MTDDTVQRRLAAIVSADVVGYTALMSQDRIGTIETLKWLRGEIDSIAGEHRGRVVDDPGDNFLLEFPSASDAVECALEIQDLTTRGDRSPNRPRMELRVGIHVGEVILDQGRIYGDGVNIAARLEALAAPGGICISKTVRDQLAGPLELSDLGERRLKNVAEPISVYAIGPTRAPLPGGAESESQRAAWIAVLPLANLSGDDQTYFADGITEDLMTRLSANRSLRVISRNSSFRYRESQLSASQIAEELGVRFLLQGSVRRSGDRVRVNARLIEAPAEQHVWADRYDVQLTDVLEAQDQIINGIAVAIDPAIRSAEVTRLRASTTENWTAWERVQRGWHEHYKFKPEANREALTHFTQALAIDPGYAEAHAGVAHAHFGDAWLLWSDDPPGSAWQAYEAAQRAVSLDDRNALCHLSLSLANYAMGRLGGTLRSAERAIELNPSLAMAYVMAAGAKTHGGKPAEGLVLANQALELNPRDPALNWFLGMKALSEFLLGDHSSAERDARRALEIRHGYLFGRVILVASLVESGRLDDARAELKTILQLDPDFTPTRLDAYIFDDPSHRDRLLRGLSVAGLEP